MSDEPVQETQAEELEPVYIRIGLLVYLRTMWSLLWGALTHPTKYTIIDATTGRIIRYE